MVEDVEKTKSEKRIRAVEDTLLLLPTQLEDIKDTQQEIVEHLEVINGSFGELDERVHKVETKWDYQEKNDEKKKVNKREFLNLTNIIIGGVVAIQALLVSVIALS